MERRYLYCADGELMLVPQQGGLLVFTELGRLQLSPVRSVSSRAA